MSPHRYRVIVIGGAAVEPLRVLRLRAGVVVAPAPGRGGVADREPLERPRRVRRQLETLHRVDELRRVGMDGFRESPRPDRKSTRLNSSHGYISYAVFCLKKKNKTNHQHGKHPSETFQAPVCC